MEALWSEQLINVFATTFGVAPNAYHPHAKRLGPFCDAGPTPAQPTDRPRPPPNREGDAGNRRRRPLQSARRRARQEAGQGRQVPQLAQNSNISSFAQRPLLMSTLAPRGNAAQSKVNST